MKAKGIAILTVVKAGFLVTARGGSGVVIAKVDDGITSGMFKEDQQYSSTGGALDIHSKDNESEHQFG